MNISGFSVVGVAKKRSGEGERKVSSASSSSGRAARSIAGASGRRRKAEDTGRRSSGSIRRGTSGIKAAGRAGRSSGSGGAASNRGAQKDRFEEKMCDAASSSSSETRPQRKQSRHTVDANGRYVQMRSGHDNCEDYIDPKTAPKPRAVPTGVSRPKYWSTEAEEGWRLQFCGWRDIYEYEAVYGQPSRWEHNGFIRQLQCKSNGYYTYWKATREVRRKT